MPPPLLRSLLAVAAALTLAAPAAQAGAVLAANGYEITVQTDAGADGGTAVYYYNTSKLGADPGGSGNHVVTGTFDDSGTARRVEASVWARGGALAEGHASADLADASLRYRGLSLEEDNHNFSQAGVFLNLADTVSFHITGASAGTHTLVQTRFVVDGTLTDTGTRTVAGQPAASIEAAFAFGASVAALATIDLNAGTGFRPVVSRALDTWLTGQWNLADTSHLVYTGNLDLVGSDVTLPFNMRLGGYCSSGAACDYAHTAQMSFVNLPGTVRYSSASGVFLTASPVPEPARSWLLMAGLGLAVPLWRRHRPGA